MWGVGPMGGWTTWRRRAAIAVGASAVLLGGASCTQRTMDESIRDITPTTTIAPAPTEPGATVPAVTVAGSEFVARVAAVDTSELVLGAAFNRQFLTLQFLAVGLDATESKCAADSITAASGDEFASRPVSQVMSGAGITPDVLLPCVSTDRMVALSKAGAGADLKRIPPDVLRSTLTELASAGYETVGLTPVESTCLAERVVGTYTDADLAEVMTTLSLPADRAVTALPTCVTGERANELGA